MIVDVKLNEQVVPIRNVREVRRAEKRRDQGKQPPFRYEWDREDEEARGMGKQPDLEEQKEDGRSLHGEEKGAGTEDKQAPGTRIDIRV